MTRSRHPLLLSFLLLLGAAPPTMPVGQFQTWLSFKRVPLSFTSGDVAITVEALACPVPATGDSTCRWEGYNNQGKVTVVAPGLRPIQLLTDPQSSYVRIAVVRLDRRDHRPGVVIESQYGGSGGIVTVQVLAPIGDGLRRVDLTRVGQGYVQGQLADAPADLSGDGVTDLVLADGRFDGVFGCNACTPRPPAIFAIRDGAFVDESADPALAAVFARDMTRHRAGCFGTNPDRNGECATYVADAARAGRFAEAWAGMLRHYNPAATERWPMRSGKPVGTFPASVRAFLSAIGYLPS